VSDRRMLVAQRISGRAVPELPERVAPCAA